SALRFAPELMPSEGVLASLGRLRIIEGSAPKSWERYAIHVIEPAVGLLAGETLLGQAVTHSSVEGRAGGRRVEAELVTGGRLVFATTGTEASPITLRLRGTQSDTQLKFSDPFTAFR